ncbi:MAG TPA: Nif3-like dinuclear metal center hexameric protein [Clostridiaceae bacterium]|jgi:dinuclear metal center YbgI/SA1388 family protein|nr:Nif3-like dinuclear metal center hexameric protein [Clostridiaceae bacterium]
MKLRNLINYIEEMAPISLQEVYDNSGLVLGNPDTEISKVLVCLDVDNEAIDHAISDNCQLVLSHHPTIFKGLKNFTGTTKESGILIKAIKNDLALYSSHTNFDSADGGLSDLLCDKLGLKNIKVLKTTSFDSAEYGAGRYGEIRSTGGMEFISRVKSKLSLDSIRYVGDIPQTITKVAVYNGSYDRDILDNLIGISPVVLITGDLKYHDAQELLYNGIFTIDAGHYGTEIIFVDVMADIIEERFSNINVIRYKGKDVFTYY